MSNGLDGGDQVAQNDTPAAAGPASTDVAAAGPAPDMVPKGAYNKTSEEEAVKDHPRAAGASSPGPTAGSRRGRAALLGAGRWSLASPAALIRRR